MEDKIRGMSKTRHPYRRGSMNQRKSLVKPAPQDIDELYRLRGRLRPLARHEEELSGKIRSFGPGTYPGHITMALVAEDPRMVTDLDAMRKDHPELVERYTKEQLVRTVKVQLK